METFSLGDMITYHGVHALHEVSREGDVGRVRYYAGRVIGGRTPVWVIWSGMSGAFVRYAAGKVQIEKLYPTLLWKSRMATMGVLTLEHKTVLDRREEVKARYRRKGEKAA